MQECGRSSGAAERLPSRQVALDPIPHGAVPGAEGIQLPVASLPCPHRRELYILAPLMLLRICAVLLGSQMGNRKEQTCAERLPRRNATPGGHFQLSFVPRSC